MLRYSDQSPPEIASRRADETAFPPLEPAFALDDHPPGVRFYKGGKSFFHPYALLQAMHLDGERLTVTFVDVDIIITGRGLHAIYVHLASQRLARVVEQGDRYAAASDGPVHVARIEEIEK